jgi:hypothetical protein
VFDSQFYEAFSHTVQIQRWAGTYDEYGSPQLQPEVLEFPCRLSGKKLGERRAMTDEDNQDVFDVWFSDPEDRLFTVNDKLTLPDEGPFQQNRYPTIYAIARVTRWDGQHHIKLQCGWQYHRQGQ